eukprot:jgi/Tetstr1/444279/TSEL_032170.t1
MLCAARLPEPAAARVSEAGGLGVEAGASAATVQPVSKEDSTHNHGAPGVCVLPSPEEEEEEAAAEASQDAALAIPEQLRDLERAALLADNHLTLENGTVRLVDMWLEGGRHHCDWLGMICDENDFVVEIKLPFQKLRGSLPVGWSALKRLDKMRLDGNELTGGLPDSWSAMYSMKAMHLNDNRLSGSLPDAWGRGLPVLSEMYIYHNNLTGTLPPSWSAMSRLRMFFLYKNFFTGLLPAEWGALGSLRALNLNDRRGAAGPHGTPETNAFQAPLPCTWLTGMAAMRTPFRNPGFHFAWPFIDEPCGEAAPQAGESEL